METQFLNDNRPKYRVDELLAKLPVADRKEARSRMNDRGISRSLLSRIRQATIGDSYSPPADTMRILASELAVTIEDLYNR